MPSNHNSNAKYTPTPNGDIEMNKMALDHNSYTPDGGCKGKIPSSGDGGGGGKGSKELRIYYKGETHFKRRTKLEKYLIILCLILFIASVALFIIALTRDSKGRWKSSFSFLFVVKLLIMKIDEWNVTLLSNSYLVTFPINQNHMTHGIYQFTRLQAFLFLLVELRFPVYFDFGKSEKKKFSGH